jgi:hypothetical protein
MALSARVSTTTIAVLNCFLALGVLGTYLKVALMGRHWGAVARFLGRPASTDLSVLEKLGFFFNDIALNFLIVPVVGTVVVSVLFRGYRAAAAVVTSIVLSVGYFVELRAQREVGHYIVRDALADLLGWASSNPGMAGDYVTAASVVKFGVLLATLVGIGVVARAATSAERAGALAASRRYRRLLTAPAAAVLGAAALVSAVSYPSQLPGSVLNVSAVGLAASALVRGETPSNASTLTFAHALESSRLLTRTSSFDAEHELIGRERASDLIVFIMETGSAHALDLATSGRDLPGTGPLYRRAFVAQQHYTTHPYSSDAMYSVLSGLYPQGRRRLLRTLGEQPLNGLMTALGSGAPVRRVYVPSFYRIELDDRMYARFGAEALYAADEQGGDPLRAVAERRADSVITSLERSGSRFERRDRAPLGARLRADFQAMEKMKLDISESVKSGRRFRVIFFPEVGHGPWLPLHAEETVLARGRALMLLQDSWLKEIVDLLRDLGRLEHTVIAVTSDHGVRTRAEDPALRAGELSDYTFRVPLLIYAPQTLQKTMVVGVPTSHIDVAPTILALFGETGGAERMQGIPIWQRTARDRIYFLAFAYGGADGFVENGAYYMWQALSGAVLNSQRFWFDDANHVAPDDPIAPFVREAIDALGRLQRMIVDGLIAGAR